MQKNKRRIHEIIEENAKLVLIFNKTRKASADWNQEKQLLLSDKIKFEEKNKKFWQMSEAVYKEKKKVDDENAELTVQKEKLAAEKLKGDDKVKKLWRQSMAIHKEKELSKKSPPPEMSYF